ncbi:MAG TPA: sigma-54 dependent transcriptional regulator, partial [Nitrospira sp.]|nr:sigma-54 dependent transcriptional regulator [Nitrospira sp.]
MQATIYVTDDEPAIRSAIVKRLSRRHHTVTGFESGEDVIRAVTQHAPDLILLDLKMPGMGGVETLRQLRPIAPQTLIIMLTAYGTVEDAVEAMRLGAYDFLIKSVDLSGVDPVVDRAIEFLTLRHRVEFSLEDQNSAYALSNIDARSPAMQLLLGQVRDVAENAKSTVLLQGETGTGKEFLARVIHCNSPRASGPFVAVNCTAIPRELFESELFGHERGAFTGAHQRKRGLLEKAEGGTLFLDEIGDLDPAMQAKLLRVLQERTFRRVGGTEDLSVDFRLMTATNRDLKKDTARGSFREDLFFRLNVVTFELPPLRVRTEDILPL